MVHIIVLANALVLWVQCDVTLVGAGGSSRSGRRTTAKPDLKTLGLAVGLIHNPIQFLYEY